MDGDTLEIHIQTIKEQMRYDRTEFTVLPGMKVRLIFTNPDAMDHNLIMVKPGATTKVAVEAAKMEATGEGTGKKWIPDTPDEIVFASNLLAHNDTQTIEFTAPTKLGRYEYICTFPGHWQLMRGAMIVTDSVKKEMLVATNELPDEGEIVATTRKMVAFWEFDHLKGEVSAANSGRSYKTGKEMFTVASCVKCHAFGRVEKAIGPDLKEIAGKYDASAVLEHILDPSIEVAEEYTTYVIETKDEEEYYGQIINETDATVTILDNPLTPETAVTIKKSDIAITDPIQISPMPTDLLITLNKTEIWDLVAYVLSGDNAKYGAFK
jgi:putative heme-binding domain-containing protein